MLNINKLVLISLLLVNVIGSASAMEWLFRRRRNASEQSEVNPSLFDYKTLQEQAKTFKMQHPWLVGNLGAKRADYEALFAEKRRYFNRERDLTKAVKKKCLWGAAEATYGGVCSVLGVACFVAWFNDKKQDYIRRDPFEYVIIPLSIEGVRWLFSGIPKIYKNARLSSIMARREKHLAEVADFEREFFAAIEGRKEVDESLFDRIKEDAGS